MLNARCNPLNISVPHVVGNNNFFKEIRCELNNVTSLSIDIGTPQSLGEILTVTPRKTPLLTLMAVELTIVY